jgi:hypothetical protein
MRQLLFPEGDNVKEEQEDDPDDYLAKLAEVRAEIRQKRRPAPASKPAKLTKPVTSRARAIAPATPAPDETPRHTNLGRLITRCEELVTEVAGQGAAVSLDERRVGWVASAWDRTGASIHICPPKATKTDAATYLKRLLQADLRKAR